MKRFLCLAFVGFVAASPLFAQEPGLQVTLKGHAGSVRSLAFSPDGKALASGSEDKTVKLWDVATGKNSATLKAHDLWGVAALAYTPDGKTLASAGVKEGEIKLWDPATGKETATFKVRDEHAACAAFSPDGKLLAVGTFEKTVKLWDLGKVEKADK